MPLLSFLSRKRHSLPANPTSTPGGSSEQDRGTAASAAATSRALGSRLTNTAAAASPGGLTSTEQEPTPPRASPSALSRQVDIDGISDSGDKQQGVAAPTIATGPRMQAAAAEEREEKRGRRHSARRDPFRLFRSRSTQFRMSSVSGSGSGSDVGEGTRTRVSWPVPRSKSISTPASETQQPPPPPPPPPQQQQQTPAHARLQGETTVPDATTTMTRGAEARPVLSGGEWAGARGASTVRMVEREPVPAPAALSSARGIAGPVLGEVDDGLHPQSPMGHVQVVQRPRPASTAVSNTPSSSIAVASASGSGGGGGGSSSSGNALQRLKRLPSLSLARGFSRRKKTETPSVVVTPATVISTSSPSSSAPESILSPSRQGTQSPSANHNKPLPPTPSHDGRTGDPATDTVPKVNHLRLNRIMATLSSLDIEKLFSGAPQYFARSEGHYTGAPHPSVAFPWDEQLAIRDLTDHVQIEDEAWGCITAWPHITRDIRRAPSASATSKVAERRRAHFYPRCRERPNMLSMQGLEKGTMGYQAALELGVADALQDEQWGFGSLGSKDRVIVDARKNLIASKAGLRRLDETTVLDHLMKNAQRYQEKHTKDRATCHELFQELFTQILHLPHRTFTDPSNLSVQIQAILKVLAQPNVWIDFSHVEWRIRLGQILWGTADDDGEDSVSDGASITDAEEMKDLHEERYWLLVHILLACELLIRLDIITEGDEIRGSIKPSEILRFERDANATVKWSMHLARVWLENIEITKADLSASGEHEPPKGWLANLTQRMTLSNDRPHSRHHERHHDSQKQQLTYVMRGKHWERQVRGLTHFARRLKWPNIDTQSALISDNCRAVTDGTPLNTPFETPMTAFTTKSKDSSYFAISKDSSSSRRQTRRQKVGAALHPAGWLSKSYVSGLMLPGEGLYHFIMSTLLENDVASMAKLGPMANLCGGFVYSDKSFWSTACVVGRVLAAGKGAVECMGWISSDVVPHDLDDGWVNVDVEDIPEDVRKTGKQARIWGKAAIERESSVLGGSDPDSVLPADFIIPYENQYKTQPPTISVEMKSLDLTAPLDSLHTTPTLEVVSPFTDASAFPEIKTYTPSIKFNVTIWEDDEDREYTFSLAKDVYFVTAHPCVPSHHVRILKSPSSPTIQQIDLSGHPFPGSGRSIGHAKIACHPLHKYFTYTSIHLSELLTKSDWTLEQVLSGSSTHTSPTITPSSSSARPPRVLVIDAVTNFIPQPEAHDIPLSPATSRTSTSLSEASISSRHSSVSSESGEGARLQRTDTEKNGGEAEQQMHSETRRRQFGSDMEILLRAICAERGWNALISRRRRGCLACAIREAGALGWQVVIRVD